MNLDSFWDLGHSKQILRLAQAEQAIGHNPTELAAEEMRARAGVEQARIGAGAHLGAANIGARGGLDVERERSKGQLDIEQLGISTLEKLGKRRESGMFGPGGSYDTRGPNRFAVPPGANPTGNDLTSSARPMMSTSDKDEQKKKRLASPGSSFGDLLYQSLSETFPESLSLGF